MLKIKNLNFSYNEKALLKNIDIDLKKQEFIGILGPNGSGKSTLLKLMLQNLTPKSGEIILFDKNIKDFKLKEFAQICGFVPQNSELRTPLKVIDTLLMSKYIHLKNTFKTYSKKDILEVEELAKTLKLDGFLQRDILSLSGGEFQKVLLARALLKKPKILFLDEPTSALDLNHAIELLSFCENLIKKQKITIIAILHDLNLASLFCDKLLFLKKGKVQYFGTTKELFKKEILKEIYNLNCEIIYQNSKPYILALKEIK
ncbi:ABC transporter ATP-binding protein [Campylobacter aviculae]|uniref:ABC transporter ATP-binding protein n=1 Tax=Campylobacter aviculae TaxID=2510190 RepID=A0A4U7BRF6_9BACT|nr:ABC transporter ATP-binding protein [Campylobacter aviculae]TKX32955.1 ABC transporter ATP-binding protein [Campylobacter aviculae]